MNINELIANVKKKLKAIIKIEDLHIEDKSFLHKNHLGNQKGKFHLKISIQSIELKNMTKIEANKTVYKALDEEMKKHIHSLQILII